MNDPVKGVIAMIAACVIWGFSPIYYKLLTHVPPLEVLSHRTIWSLVFFGAVLIWQRRFAVVFGLLAERRSLILVGAASVMISVNWFVYIFAIQIGQTVATSLGYYIFPLVAVLLGVAFLGERLSIVKWISVGIAALAVALLAIGLGVAPWISLVLAVSFGLYGLVKKWIDAGPVISVTGEVLILSPVALLWLWGVHFEGWQGVAGRSGGMFGNGIRDSLILILSGLVTAGPLVLYSYASRRITLATIGLVQYLNPTFQFFCAVVIFGEPFTRWHTITFILIWIALAIYSVEALRQERAERKAVAKASSSSATVK